jgi:hypothetical protein
MTIVFAERTFCKVDNINIEMHRNPVNRAKQLQGTHCSCRWICLKFIQENDIKLSPDNRLAF